MRAINFLKYDFRRSRYIFLLSIVLFAPIAAMMAFSVESLLGVFSYMALVVIISPTSLFTYEQKADCGFDGLLPAKDSDKVIGRYLLGCVCIVFQLTLGFVISCIVTIFSDMKISELPVIFMVFIAATLIYLSIAFVINYSLGRNLNNQVRSIMVVVPCLIIWGIVNTFIGLVVEEDITGFIINVINNKEVLSAIALVIGVVMYIISAMISIQIVKRKDYR